MAYMLKLILAKQIQLADKVINAANEASSFKSHCSDLKEKTKLLAGLLHQTARIGKDLYERPTLLVIDDTNQVLERALSLVQKCRTNCLAKRAFFNIIPAAAAFQKTSSQLQNSANKLSWLLRIPTAIYDGSKEYYLCHSPPLAANEPVLCFIWEQIAILSSGSLSHQLAAAKTLVSFTNDSACHEKLIQDGDCSVFAKVLKEGPMQLQAEVAGAISELVANYAPFQQHFAQHNIIPLLVSHLAFETTHIWVELISKIAQ